MTIEVFPKSADELTPAVLTTLVAVQFPGSGVAGFEVVGYNQFGDGMVSTADRALLELEYTPGSMADLPPRALLKLPRDIGSDIKAIYINETRFYLRLGKEVPVETPRLLGGVYDPGSEHFGLLLEDITLRGATFPNVSQRISLEQVEAIVDMLAALHARYWQSPRFDADLSWVEAHVDGPVSELMNNFACLVIQSEIEENRFKHDLVSKIRMTDAEMREGTQKLQRHQGTLPQTLLHGDTHLGNTYVLPGGRVGLIDWQLTVRGYCVHDVSYIIVTALSVDLRRKHERELLQRYLARLAEFGVKEPPAFDVFWKEYRRSIMWGIYTGWLTTSVVNYGWEITVVNLFRLLTAFEDLETKQAIDELV